ncbi:MAG: cupin domain-containing protein [Miltoncostaeaceae bacterium]
MPVNEPVLTGPDSGEKVTYGNGSSAELKVTGEQTDGEYAALLYRVKPGDEPPLHTHSHEDEMVHVIDGEVTAIVGEAEIPVGPGAYAALPRGIPHTIRVTSEEAVLLITAVPAGLERFFVPRDGESPDPADFGLTIH